MWPWLRLCRFVLAWRITRSWTCGPSQQCQRHARHDHRVRHGDPDPRQPGQRSANIAANYSSGVAFLVIATWQLPASFQPIHDKSAGTPSCLAAKTCLRSRLASTPSDSKSSSAMPSNVACRHHQLAPGRPLHHPRGDVHVDAQPVRTDPLRPAGVDADPHPRRVAVHVKGFHRFPSLDRGGNRRRRLGEHRHDAVAHSLDDLAARLQQRRLDDLRDAAKEFERGVVARTQRPRREAHQVGEDDRRLPVGGLAGHPLGQRLPHLQSAQADFARGGLAMQQSIGGACGGAGTADAGRRQRIAELGITGQRASGAAQEGDDGRAVVGALQPRHGPG